MNDLAEIVLHEKPRLDSGEAFHVKQFTLETVLHLNAGFFRFFSGFQPTPPL